MIEKIDKNIENDSVNRHTVMCSAESTVVHHRNMPCHAWNQVDALSEFVVRTFMIHGKLGIF